MAIGDTHTRLARVAECPVPVSVAMIEPDPVPMIPPPRQVVPSKSLQAAKRSKRNSFGKLRFIGMAIPESMVGAEHSLQIGIRFTIWALKLASDPSANQIAERFGVSRATAYRWLRAWLAEREVHHGFG